MVKILSEQKLDFNNVLICPNESEINSRSNIDLNIKYTFRNAKNMEWTGIPIISANMDTTGTFEVYDTLSKFNIITALNKFYTKDDLIKETSKRSMNPDLFMISTGIRNNALNNLIDIFKVIDCNWICIDVANGYISDFKEFCKTVRNTFPNKIIVAGNVVTKEHVETLITYSGVDVIKVGIGSGAVCTTRLKAGVGMPQLSAVLECAEIAHKLGGHIISDGGITCPGDVSKAYCAGADFVMLGSALAGHDENPGEVIEDDSGIKYKLYYGMSSKYAMEKHFGKMNDYRASEGRYLKLKYKGSMKNTILDYFGGIRSTCTYINANSIKDMFIKATFVIVSQQVNASLL